MKNSIKFAFFFFALFIVTELSIAQVDRSTYYNRGKNFYYNYFYKPINNVDSIDVYTMYKVAYDLLRFTKMTGTNSYIAYPEFEIEFRDEDGIIRKRIKKKDTIIVDDYSLINRIDIFYFGSIEAKLKYKKYTPVLYLWNDVSLKLAEKELPELDLMSFKNGTRLSSPLICFQDDEIEAPNLYPFLLDMNAAFSSKDIFFYFISNNIEGNEEYQASIEYLDAGRSSIDWTGNSIIKLNTKFISDRIIEFKNHTPKRPSFELTGGNPQEQGFEGIVKIKFTSDKTAPGKYKLRLWRKNTQDTSEFDFQIIWDNLSYTLRTPNYAADIMYLVLTDDEYDDIKSGSDREITHNIYEWWRKHDPTPFTVYNEAMAEFFSRADYAFFNFKTIYEKDGAQTDRGKIHILNGAPDEKKSIIDKSSKSSEIWIYRNLKKKYIFETDSSNRIYLKAIEDL